MPQDPETCHHGYLHSAGFGILDTAFHDKGSSQHFISNVSCTGDELTIADCDHSIAPVAECNDVAVMCRGIIAIRYWLNLLIRL